MRKILSVILCAALFLPVLFRPSSVNAYPGDPFRNRKTQAESGILVYVDYYDGKTEKYHKEVPVTYDAQGRVLDDGLTYHLYDKTGHEIMISNPMYQFPYFGDLHIGNSTEPRIQYNADGTPSNYARSYRNVRFGYNSKGSVKTIEQYQNDFVEYRFTYTYSGNQIQKITLDDYSGGAGGKTVYTFSYENDRLTKIHSVREDGGKSYHYETDAVYTYQNDRLKSVVYSGQEGTVYEAAYYSYDGSGRVIVLETYSFDKGEEGWKVYYQYPEEPETEAPTEKPTEKATEPEQPDTEKVKIDHFFPEPGLTAERFTDHIEIYFQEGTVITAVNYDSAKISICDAESKEEVYTAGKGSDTKIYNSTFQIRGNWFCWKLPSPSLNTNPFQKNHTYYLKMEEGFLSFSKGNQKVSVKSPKTWYYTVGTKKTEDTFDFTWNDFGTPNHSYCYYSDDFFLRTGYQYNCRLATMSLCMSMAAYNATDSSKGYANIYELFQTLGFGNIYYNADYKNPTKATTTGVAIASKPLQDGTTLIGIAVRGGAYGAEWAGNFNVGTSGDHAGFTIGKENVLNALKAYFTKNNGNQIRGKIKIWIAGYSRGSAIANLTAAALDRGFDLGGNVSYKAEDVYAYCFEVPNNTVDPDFEKPLYHNIFNIRNPIDVVTKIPLAKWGFHVYGKVLRLPAYGVNNFYFDAYSEAAFKEFRSMTKGIGLIQTGNMLEVLKVIEDGLGRKVKTRDKYVSKYQSKLMKKMNECENDDESMTALYLLAFDIAVNDDPYGELAAMIVCCLDYTGSTDWKSMKNDVIQLFKIPHYPTLTLAWMRTLDGSGVLEEQLNKSQTIEGAAVTGVVESILSTKVTARCPVNIAVYDIDHVKIAELKNGTEFVAEDSPVAAFYGTDGAMNFYVPNLSTVRFEITPYGDGEMTLTLENVDYDSGGTVKTVVYPDLTVRKDKGLSMDLDTGFLGSDYQAELRDAGGRAIAPSYEFSPDTETYYTITINTEGNGSAYGGGEAVQGAFTKLYAVPADENTIFRGWFDEKGTLITTDAVLSYRGWNDAVLEARFEKKDGQTAPTEPATESKPAPETKPDGGSDRKEPDSPLIPIMILLILPGLAAVIIGIILLNKNRKKR